MTIQRVRACARVLTSACAVACIGCITGGLAGLTACSGEREPASTSAKDAVTAAGTTGASAPAASQGDLRGADLGVGASLNGAIPFPPDNAWNADISQAPVDPRSDTLIRGIGSDKALRPDFGAGSLRHRHIGIPYVIVGGSQPRVPIRFIEHADQSDPGPYPVPSDAPVEGGPDAEGDRHVIVIDRDRKRLYELFKAYPDKDGGWRAASGAVFHLDSNAVRPTAQPGWTSADAAGLPVFPGLVRYDEAMRGPGGIRHALRFTVAHTRRAYVPPASHWASRDTSETRPPMGMRVRLKDSYAIPPHFSAESKAVLRALQTHGMILADNGSDWFISGAPDPRWDDTRLKAEIGQVRGRDLEVIRMDGLVAGR